MSEALAGLEGEALGALRALSLSELFDQPRRDFTIRHPAAPGSAFQAMPFIEPPATEPAFDAAAAEAEQAAMRAAELNDAREQGYAAGMEAGRAENLAAVEAIVGECRALIQSLENARAIDRAALGPLLKNAVMDLAAQIVEAHVAVEPAFVNGCVGRVLTTIKEAHEAARLYLNPDDIANIGADAAAGFEKLSIVADAGLARGNVRLETGGGEVEDGVATRIVRLEHALRAAGLAA